MSDKKSNNKLVIPKSKKKDLQGFDEIVDLITEDQQSKPTRIQVEDYEVFNYLEKELQRLEKLDNFFRNQIPLLDEKPQTKNLLDLERLELDRVKQMFLKKVSAPDSQFLNNMDIMFQTVFKG